MRAQCTCPAWRIGAAWKIQPPRGAGALRSASMRPTIMEFSMPYILALDEGTTSARAIVFDLDGGIRAVAQKEFTQRFPQPGWVEHDADEIWSAQIGVAVEAL